MQKSFSFKQVQNFCNIEMERIKNTTQGEQHKCEEYRNPETGELIKEKLAFQFLFEHALEDEQESLLPEVVESVQEWFDSWMWRKNFQNKVLPINGNMF